MLPGRLTDTSARHPLETSSLLADFPYKTIQRRARRKPWGNEIANPRVIAAWDIAHGPCEETRAAGHGRNVARQPRAHTSRKHAHATPFADPHVKASRQGK